MPETFKFKINDSDLPPEESTLHKGLRVVGSALNTPFLDYFPKLKQAQEAHTGERAMKLSEHLKNAKMTPEQKDALAEGSLQMDRAMVGADQSINPALIANLGAMGLAGIPGRVMNALVGASAAPGAIDETKKVITGDPTASKARAAMDIGNVALGAYGALRGGHLPTRGTSEPTPPSGPGNPPSPPPSPIIEGGTRIWPAPPSNPVGKAPKPKSPTPLEQFSARQTTEQAVNPVAKKIVGEQLVKPAVQSLKAGIADTRPSTTSIATPPSPLEAAPDEIAQAGLRVGMPNAEPPSAATQAALNKPANQNMGKVQLSASKQAEKAATRAEQAADLANSPKSLADIEKSHQAANDLRAKEEVGAAKAQQESNDQQTAAARIEKALANGLQEQDPVVAETLQEKVPGGKRTFTQKFVPPDGDAVDAIPEGGGGESATTEGTPAPPKPKPTGKRSKDAPPAGTPAGDIYDEWRASGRSHKLSLTLAKKGTKKLPPQNLDVATETALTPEATAATPASTEAVTSEVSPVEATPPPESTGIATPRDLTPPPSVVKGSEDLEDILNRTGTLKDGEPSPGNGTYKEPEDVVPGGVEATPEAKSAIAQLMKQLENPVEPEITTEGGAAPIRSVAEPASNPPASAKAAEGGPTAPAPEATPLFDESGMQSYDRFSNAIDDVVRQATPEDYANLNSPTTKAGRAAANNSALEASNAKRVAEGLPPQTWEDLTPQALANQGATTQDPTTGGSFADTLKKILSERGGSETGAMDPILAARIGLGGTGAALGYKDAPITGDPLTDALLMGAGGALVPEGIKGFGALGNKVMDSYNSRAAIGQGLIDARRSGMLGPSALAKKVLSDSANVPIAAMAHPERIPDLLRSLRDTPHVQNFMEGFRDPEGLSGYDTSSSPVYSAISKTPLSAFQRAISGTTNVFKNIHENAGFSPEEAELYTLSNPQPRSEAGKKVLASINSNWLGKYFSGFPRMGVRLAEGAIEHSPLQWFLPKDSALGGGSPLKAAIGPLAGMAAFAATPPGFAQDHPYIAPVLGASGGLVAPWTMAGMYASGRMKGSDEARPDYAAALREVGRTNPESQVLEQFTSKPGTFIRNHLGSYDTMLAPIAKGVSALRGVQTEPDMNHEYPYVGTTLNRLLANIPVVRDELPVKDEPLVGKHHTEQFKFKVE